MGSTTVQAPTPISYSESMRDALLAQAESQRGTGAFADIGPLIGLEQEYRPQWTNLELQSLQQSLQGTPGGTRTVQDTRMTERSRQVVNPEFQEALNRGEISYDPNVGEYGYGRAGDRNWDRFSRSSRGEIPQYIDETYETPEVYDRTIEGEATPGLIQQYQQDIAPAISAIDAEALRARTESEQGIIDQYGQGLANKLRDAAGNRELIESIVSDAVGEGDPSGLAQLVDDAQYARGQSGIIVPPPGYEPGEIVAPGVTAPGISAGRELTTRGLVAPDIRVPGEPGYVPQGRAGLQEAMGGQVLRAGEDELRRPMGELDTALQSRAVERLDDGLTDAEKRGIQQGQRQAWTARGLGTTMPAAISEAYYVARAGEQRQRENEAMARGVAGELEQRRQGRLGTGAGMIGQAAGQRLGAYQADIGRGTGQQQFGLQTSLAGGELGLRAGEFSEGQRLAAQQGMLGDEQARELSRAQLGLQAQTTGGQFGLQAQLAREEAASSAGGMRQQYGLAYGQEEENRRRRALEQDRTFRMGVLGLQDQMAGTQYGRRVGAAGLAQQTGGDPFLSLLGRPSGVSQMTPAYAGAGQALYGGAGPNIFQPESQMQQNLAMSNQQAAMATNAAQAQLSGAMWGGLGSAVGGMFGGAGKGLFSIATSP